MTVEYEWNNFLPHNQPFIEIQPYIKGENRKCTPVLANFALTSSAVFVLRNLNLVINTVLIIKKKLMD